MNFVDVNQAINLLNNGEIVILPTETVYGIFCKEKADFNKIFQIKSREKNKNLCTYINIIPEEFNQYKSFIPGPLTIVSNKIGYRVSANKLLQTIIEKTGPLLGSSANISGKFPITHSKHLSDFDNIPILEDDENILGIESTILNIDNNLILRNGYINPEKLIKNYITKFYKLNYNYDKLNFILDSNIEIQNIVPIFKTFWYNLNEQIINNKLPIKLNSYFTKNREQIYYINLLNNIITSLV